MNTRNKIIFLDIDGVLNGYNFWSLTGWKIACKLNIRDWYRTHIRKPFGIHEEKVRHLSKIIEKTNAKVVMSSSWRYGWWKTPYEKQTENQKRLTDLLKKYNIEVIDITPKLLDGRRDTEIQTWIKNHSNEIYSFVILDDEKFDLECFVGNRLVQTFSTINIPFIKGQYAECVGLKRKHINIAIGILSNEIQGSEKYEFL